MLGNIDLPTDYLKKFGNSIRIEFVQDLGYTVEDCL